MDKCNKIASYVLYGIIALSIVVLILFYCVGFNNMESLPSGFYNSPKNTDLLLYWQYALAVITIIVTFVGAISSKGGKIDSNMSKSAKMLTLIGEWIFLPILVVAFFLGDDTPLRLGKGLYTDTFWLAATDAMLYTIYILLALAIIGLIVNMSGVCKK